MKLEECPSSEVKFYFSQSTVIGYYITWLVPVLLVYIGSSVNFAMYMLVGGKFREAFRETFGGLLGYIRDRVSSAWQTVSTRIWTTEHVTSRPERDAELPLGVMTSRI